MPFCECDGTLNGRREECSCVEDGVLICTSCRRPIECDWSHMTDEPHAATGFHIWFYHCDEHADAALDCAYR